MTCCSPRYSRRNLNLWLEHRDLRKKQLVSSPALENAEIADDHGYFCTFKLNRKSFERIASTKYENGFVEPDGTVCIRAMDMPLASVN